MTVQEGSNNEEVPAKITAVAQSHDFPKGVGRTVGFLEAAAYPFRALAYIAKNPSLWLWLLIPVVLNILVGVWTWYYSGTWISAWMADNLVAGSAIQDWVKLFANMLQYVVQFALAVFAMIVVGNLLVIPFNEWLSEKVDRKLGWEPCPTSLTFSANASHLWLVTRYELSRMSIYVSLMVPLMFLSLVPSVAAFTIPLKFIITVLFLSMDNFSYSLDRRGHIGVSCKFRFIFSRFLPCIGFGSGMTLFLMIPLVNFVFLPVGAIGATMLYWHMNPDGDHRPSPGSAA